jgi:hypothetical protein
MDLSIGGCWVDIYAEWMARKPRIHYPGARLDATKNVVTAFSKTTSGTRFGGFLFASLARRQ